MIQATVPVSMVTGESDAGGSAQGVVRILVTDTAIATPAAVSAFAELTSSRRPTVERAKWDGLEIGVTLLFAQVLLAAFWDFWVGWKTQQVF